MNKRGQMQISFGMIFSIIIIIATIGVATYIIISFFSIQENIACKLFYSDLQERVDTAWNRDRTRDSFSASVPIRTQYVCIGNSTSIPMTTQEQKIFDETFNYLTEKTSISFYPASACGDEKFNFEIEHSVSFGNKFFCISVKESKARLTMSYDITKDTAVILGQ